MPFYKPTPISSSKQLVARNPRRQSPPRLSVADGNSSPPTRSLSPGRAIGSATWPEKRRRRSTLAPPSAPVLQLSRRCAIYLAPHHRDPFAAFSTEPRTSSSPSWSGASPLTALSLLRASAASRNPTARGISTAATPPQNSRSRRGSPLESRRRRYAFVARVCCQDCHSSPVSPSDSVVACACLQSVFSSMPTESSPASNRQS